MRVRFLGEEGLSGLTAGSVWLIVQGGKGALIYETKSPDFRSLEVGICGITIIKSLSRNRRWT